MVALQKSFTAMTVELSRATSAVLGRYGEQFAAVMLEKTGLYDVSFTRIHQRRGDLIAIDTATGESLRVEVKTARRGKDRKWRFTLYKQGCTDHRDADVVLLLAVLKTGRVVPFVIPVADVRDRTFIAITSHPEIYSGQWAQYRQRTSELTLEVQ